MNSSPAVADGVVYVGSDNNFLYALNANTGELLWRYETGGNVGSSPVVMAGVVYVSSSDGYLYALDTDSSSTTESPVAPAVSSPAPSTPATPVVSSPTPETPVSQVVTPIAPGTYRVGEDIQPGMYRGKAGTGFLNSCYWERLKGASGEFSDILANDNAEGQFYIEVLSTDAYLKVDCEITPLEASPSRTCPTARLNREHTW